jgi:hypothetical protein
MSQAVMEICEQNVERRDKRANQQVKYSPIIEAVPTQELESETQSECSNDTKSPMNDAPIYPHPAEGVDIFHSVCNTIAVDECLRPYPEINTRVKKSAARNTLVAGNTSEQIRRGEAGPTTFQISDLFVPVVNNIR